MPIQPPLTETECRDMWERESGRTIADEEWDQLYLVALGTGPDDASFSTPGQALSALRDATARLARTWGGGDRTPVLYSVDPPKRWESFQLSRFARFAVDAARARRLFGLDGPVKYDLVPDLLKCAEHDQGWPGTPCEVARLWFVDDSFDGWGSVLVCLTDEESWPSGEANIAFVSETERAEWAAAWRKLRLQVLWDLVEQVVDQTGTTAFGALHWALCDSVPGVPWISVEARPAFGTDGWNSWMQINVGSFSVRPDEVADAYGRAQKRLLSDFGTDSRAPRFGRTTTAGDEKVTFCRPLRSAGMTWPEITEEWNEKHPDQRYDAGSFSRVCRRHAKRLGMDL